MVPKTERFELRLEPGLIARIDEWRTKEGDLPSRSEAVRRLIEMGLHNDAALSPGERLITTMLCDISEQLKIKGDIDTKFVKSAMWGGHFWALERTYQSIIQTEPIENSIAVEAISILEMWDYIRMSYERMPASDKKHVKENVQFFNEPVTFPGFDGNSEPKHHSVACFFIRKMGYFQNLDTKKDLNSHCPSLHRYRRMLEVFSPMLLNLMGNDLTKEQVVKVLEAPYEGI